MGWNVSHGSNQYGEERRSYTTVSNLSQHLENCLSGSDWRKIKHLFGRSSGDPKSVGPREAGQIAAILRTAAHNRRMPADWGLEALAFASAADRAHRAGQPWRWS
ncbi:hypothetical protein [Streptomyces niveus]|uniref:DUF7739 domain-containing protein n=1 Tax=Streptomyces niveus TaxID=193462 RepID=UPI00386D8E3F